MSVRPDAAATRAVMVGVSRYTSLEPLPAVATNLSALASALASPDAWHLAEKHCAVIAEPQRAHEVLDAVWQHAQEATDTLLFYFAGHGLIDGRGELFLGLPASRHGLSHTGIPYQSLREIMIGGHARRYVLILDCCFSGRALGLMSGTDELIDTAQIEGSYLMAAAGENVTALAPPGETHTAFTGELLACLATGVPDGPPELDLEAVYHDVRRRLASKGRPLPQQRGRNSASSLVMVRNVAYRPSAHRSSPAPVDKVRWPDPKSFSVQRDFLDGLVQVRVNTGLTLQRIAEAAAPPMSPGTISSLINRTTLPARWVTVGRYLAACGLSTEEIAAWKDAWERLRLVPDLMRPATSEAFSAKAQLRRPDLPRWWARRGARRPDSET